MRVQVAESNAALSLAEAQKANAAGAGKQGGAAGGEGADGADALLQARQEIEKLREEVKWATSDKERAITVCSAAVDNEKLCSAEVWTCARARTNSTQIAHVLIHAHGYAHA